MDESHKEKGKKPLESDMEKSTNNINETSMVASSKPATTSKNTSNESNKVFSIVLSRIKYTGDGENSTYVPGKRITRLQSKALESGKSTKEQPVKASGSDLQKKGNDNSNVAGSQKSKRDLSPNNRDTTPAKRVNRSKSTMVESNTYVAGKRNKRLASKQHGSSNDKDSTSDKDSFSRLIAMNCKLTSELLDSKKMLSEKNNALLQMQQNLFDKELNIVTMKDLLSYKEKQLEMLRKEFDQMKNERFCTDLIQFDDAPKSQADLGNCTSEDMNDEATDSASTSLVDLLGFDTPQTADKSTSEETADEATNEDATDGEIQNKAGQDSEFQWTPLFNSN